MPPPYRTPSHRPTKKRRRAAYEDEDKRVQTHLPRRGQIQRCSNCGAAGHKRRGCPKPPKSAQVSKKTKSNSATKGKGATKSTKGGIKKSLSQPPPSSMEKGKAAAASSSSQPLPRSPPIAKQSLVGSTRRARPIPSRASQVQTSSQPIKTAATALQAPRPKTRSSSQPTKISTKETTKASTSGKKPVFCVRSVCSPHVSPKNLKMMAKLPPGSWGNI
ncbi:hypothetical protein PIB30_017307 [Stylosanthes scabra]|uniref:CCHC-type domain-containing protein n=1 Tax=Stylosanthes scabra TaxID=79078 RepID=A0ABU6S870_9FABA|nr:hypothetical protein [Stylosanthes scabra]